MRSSVMSERSRRRSTKSGVRHLLVAYPIVRSRAFRLAAGVGAAAFLQIPLVPASIGKRQLRGNSGNLSLHGDFVYFATAKMNSASLRRRSGPSSCPCCGRRVKYTRVWLGVAWVFTLD